MEKTLNILIIALVAVVGLQIASVNFLVRGVNYTELLAVNNAGLHAAYSLMP